MVLINANIQASEWQSGLAPICMLYAFKQQYMS